MRVGNTFLSQFIDDSIQLRQGEMKRCRGSSSSMYWDSCCDGEVNEAVVTACVGKVSRLGIRGGDLSCATDVVLSEFATEADIK